MLPWNGNELVLTNSLVSVEFGNELALTNCENQL